MSMHYVSSVVAFVEEGFELFLKIKILRGDPLNCFENKDPPQVVLLPEAYLYYSLLKPIFI